MIGVTKSLGGVPVFINDAQAPVYRTVVPKAWHRRRGYSARVNKKWCKRFGVIGQGMLIPDGSYIVIPTVPFGNFLCMNSATFADLKRRLAQ